MGRGTDGPETVLRRAPAWIAASRASAYFAGMMNTPTDDLEGFGRFSAWLAQAALGDTGRNADGTLDNNIGALPFKDLFGAICDRLNAWIGPFSRISLGMEVLHPELSGGTLYWRDGKVEQTDITRAGFVGFEDYLKRPVYVVEQTNRPWRWRAGDAVPDMPLIRSLAEQGVTDYCLLPLPAQDTSRTSTMSFATKRTGGFAHLGGAEDGLALLRRVAWAVTPFVERVLLRIIALDLLDAYVGKIAGARVYGGQIERGAVVPVDAAILMADLRDFTGLSEKLGDTETVDLLNRYFDTLGEAIAAHDGQILKFIGDGLLAVFPIAATAAAKDVAEAALSASIRARANLARLNDTLAAEGKQRIDFGIGLHQGGVAFGNIGAGTRLDFTVIGTAVNTASRLQDLTKKLGQPILASAAFQQGLGRPMRSLGFHALRCVAAPIEVFAPD